MNEFKVVPVEPTEEMLNAGNEAAQVGGCDLYGLKRELLNGWKAMLAVAPYSSLRPCCSISAEDEATLNAGDFNAEELFGIGGKPSCPECTPSSRTTVELIPAAPADKRVTELEGLLGTARMYIEDLADSLGNACEFFEGEDDEDPQAQSECDEARQFANRIRAALGQELRP